ncbi:MAG: nickel-responsive transcriptional regulator NikR [Candidatus Omnitrophota bacterium]|jgi:CopG family nickel-responsive transcriptional regulator
MSKIIRFGVSLEESLLEGFDRRIKNKNYSSRSEAIRDMIREYLMKAEWELNSEVAGVISLVYDHHRRELVKKLMDIQHDYGKLIISSQHIHLDHNNCLEIIAVSGLAREAEKLSDSLKSVKGVKHSAMSMSTTGKHID